LLEAIYRYHDGTKHHFHRFARSLGYLDWASQPRPFRAFSGAPVYSLYPAPGQDTHAYVPHVVTYDQLFRPPTEVQPLSASAVGDVLRHAFGLTAWKRYGQSRWALRANPSSGNLHPTEAYVVCGALPGLADSAAVYHYAPDRHVVEQRCAFDTDAWLSVCGGRGDILLVALTSIHWREAWKYGERAFRYCQHDLGHAIAAVGVSAAMAGWRATVLPGWSHRSIAALTGVDRDGDFAEAEREEPGCVMAIAASDSANVPSDEGRRLADAVQVGRWSGRASQLSEDHVAWTFIDESARVTETQRSEVRDQTSEARDQRSEVGGQRSEVGGQRAEGGGQDRGLDARALVRQRRSALAFDGHSSLARSVFFRMLSRVMPGLYAPWNVLWWTPRIQLALFVHRVDDLAPGMYVLARDPKALDRLRAAVRREFLWEPADDGLPFVCLARGDCRTLSKRLSCDQDIAADGFFSLGMIAEFDASIDANGASFYRNLFWESGVVGQALYLEAEAAGARATGIGCFYDDPVHDVLGLEGHAFQSLYHFTVGMPVEDSRLTTEPGYEWEA
jgi:SagB-type dehydrogenase family enzyme